MEELLSSILIFVCFFIYFLLPPSHNSLLILGFPPSSVSLDKFDFFSFFLSLVLYDVGLNVKNCQTAKFLLSFYMRCFLYARSLYNKYFKGTSVAQNTSSKSMVMAWSILFSKR